MILKIETNFAEVQRYLDKFPDNIVKKAVSRSLRRVGPSTVNHAAAAIISKKLINFKLPELKKKRMRAFFVTRGSIGDMVARVYFNSSGENVARFFAKKRTVAVSTNRFGNKRVGVIASIPGQAAGLVPGGFIVDKSKLKGSASSLKYDPVMKRKTESSRAPMVSLKGPSISQIVIESGVLEASTRHASERLKVEIEENINYFLSQE